MERTWAIAGIDLHVEVSGTRVARSLDLNDVVALWEGCGLVPSERGFRNELTYKLLKDPALALVKTADVATLTDAGQVVTYSFEVTNTGNVTITEPRREELAFSPPYLSNVATLMTHVDVPELQSIEAIDEAFAGLTGLSYPGTLHEARMDALREEHFPEMETVQVETNDELVSMAASGEGYFGYIDIYNYWRAVEEGAPLRRHPVADDASEEFGVIMPRGSDWAGVMERFFREHDGVQGSDWYRALLREHLGDELAGLLLPSGPGSLPRES
jgi:hypothetical protein